MQCEACGHQNLPGARFCASCGAQLPSEHTGPDPMIGQLVGGRFRVTGVLGEGGMGIVYVGEQHMGSTVRKVAIKTLHQHLSKDPSVLARFHRECGTVAQLEHPNTIKVYDFGSTADGTLYIAMEFVAGRPLADVIRDDGALSPDRVVKIMRQVCGALDEAHDKGIIHRDLKPENVILTTRAGETDFAKVLDFGIAARSESADASKEAKLTQQGMVLGTPPYMSPEQFTGKALDKRSDIYSLGVMAYEMLAGRLPFDADTPWQWATQHMTAQPIPFETAAPARHIPTGMRDAILKALSKDRDHRQATARDFFSELSDGARITVEAPPPQQHTGTAAMEAVPDFNSPVPVTPLNMGPIGGSPQPGMPIAAARVPIPPGPSAMRGKQGGGKGLIVGLGVAAAVLFVAIAVFAAVSLGGDGEDDIQPIQIPTTTATTPTPTPTTPAGGSTSVAEIPTTPPPDPEPQPTATATTPPKVATGGSGGTRSPGAGGTPTAAGGGCDACLTQAGSSIPAAVASFRSCADPTKKEACKRAIQGKARHTVQSAFLNGGCPAAVAAARAAEGIGAGSPGLTATLRKNNCAN